MKEKITKALRKEFFERFAALITGAFTFVAALAWNSAVQAIIAKYVSPGGGILGMALYAVIVTLIAVIAIMQINAVAHALEKNDEKVENKNK